ncbi:MAG: hypothetical protein ACUZ77_00375 [Candidatus Brocadiales bacterium]
MSPSAGTVSPLLRGEAVDGLTSRPFLTTTLPPIDMPKESNRGNILEASQNRYGRDREVVEGLIYTLLC